MARGRPLLKLPIRFCGDTLAGEVSELPNDAWMAHPQQYDGNISVPLVSPGGAPNHQCFGPMGPTEWLSRCPYILEIMQALSATWGRCRLMGLEPGAIVPEHVDIHYYWRTHFRIHIPVVTNPQVEFTCDGTTINMKAGECWLLDSFFMHSVANRGTETRVHLVLDTVGSGRLWDLIDGARDGARDEELLEPGKTEVQSLEFEQINAPVVMSPWEIKTHVAYIAEWTDVQPGLGEIMAILDRFIMVWAGTWAAYGPSEEGLPIYARHLDDVRAALSAFDGPRVMMRNGPALLNSIERFILAHAIAPAVLQRLRGGSGPALPFRMTG